MKLVNYLASVFWGDSEVEHIAKGREGDCILLRKNKKAIVLKGFPYEEFVKIKDYNVVWIDVRFSEKEKWILVWIDCELTNCVETVKIINNKVVVKEEGRVNYNFVF